MTGAEGRNRKTAIRRAMDLRARRDRFIGELRSDLAKSGFEPAEIDEAVESLSERRLLDDPALAARRVRDWRRAGRSNADCIARLRSKGASRSVAEAAVHGTADGPEDESDPELEAAINAVRKAVGPSKDRVPVPRLVGRLARRGFRLDTIRAALRHSGLPDPSSLEPETDR